MAIQQATSFRPDGYQYTMAFRRGRTDGTVKLFKHSKFPAGLIGRVTEALRELGEEYRVEIEESPDSKPGIVGLTLVGVEQRWYQDDAVEAALLNPRGVIQAPTGAGKTAIGARVIAARAKHALVVVPTIDLLHQYRRFLQDHVLMDGRPVEIGQLGDGEVQPKPITVATVRTAAKALGVAYTKYEYGEYDDRERDTDVSPAKLREWIEAIGTLVVDEAHILGAQTVYDVATKIPAPNKYGFSASPWRDDGADLMIEAATGPKIYRIETKVLVDEKFLVPPIIRVVDTKDWWTPAAWGQTCTRCGTTRAMTARGPAQRCTDCGCTTFRSEFTDAYRHEIVENARRNLEIAKIVNGLSDPTLVLVKQVKHGRLLEPMIESSVFLSGNNQGEERTKVFNQMRAGKVRVLIATTIADLGLDIPILTNLVLAGGGKSSTRHLQRIGRVARPYPGKDFARVIDFDDGHVHRWFRDHARARRRIERAEWGDSALWI